MKKDFIYNKERNLYLEGFSIHTIRFWNNEILSDLEKVLDQIQKQVKAQH